MKFLHIADLHFGKTMNGISLIEEDQPAWVEGFLALARDIHPDGILIAGDVYDRAAPSGDAFALFDRLLTSLAAEDIPVFFIAGNHDAGQKLDYGREFLEKSRVYSSGSLRRELTHITLRDEFGPVTIWLLPYLFPALASEAVGEELRDYSSAVARLLELQPMDKTRRNVLVAHQNVTAYGEEAARGGSESYVGGVGGIDYRLFDDFSYVALGHIHSGVAVGRPEVRYAGSPLCYHFDETRFPQKGALLVELGRGVREVKVTPMAIEPRHPVRVARGTMEEILESEKKVTSTGEYIKAAVLGHRYTPEEHDTLKALVESHGSLLLEMVSEGNTPLLQRQEREEKALSTGELLRNFFREQKGREPEGAEEKLIAYLEEVLARAEAKGESENPDAEETEALCAYAVKIGQEEKKK